MKCSVFLVLLSIGSSATTQAGSPDGIPLWTNRYAGPGENPDSPVAIAIDGNGSVMVGGCNFVIKYSNSGTPLWTNRYDGLRIPGAQAMAVDAQGNVIITGISGGDSTGDDYATVKYSNTGVPLWTNRYVGPGYCDDWPCGLAIDKNGNVFVTGFSGTEDFSEDFLTVAYSAAGIPLWTNRYNAENGVDEATGIALDGDGNVFVTGFSHWGFLPDSFYSTIKYSGAGVPLWTNRFSYFSAKAKSIAVDSDGNVLVTGYCYDVGTDYATVKYSNAGVPLWTNRYNGSGDSFDVPVSVRTDTSGNVFVTGTSGNNTGGADYATVAYSSAGVPLWTNLFAYAELPNAEGGPAALVVDGKGNIIVTGSCRNTNSFMDFLTIKYSNSGLLLWTNRFEGFAGFYAHSTAVANDDFGDVFVSGPSAASGIQGDYEYVTIKYSASSSLPARLDFTVLNGRLVLSWTNAGFSLQSATDISGPFTLVSGATSPYTNTVIDAQKFFRLKAD